MPRRLTFRQRLERFPPILLRVVLIRKDWDPDDAELATECGLTMAQLKFVSYSPRWDGPVMQFLWPYLRGCRVDLEHRRGFRRLEFMRRHGCRRLSKSPNWPAIEERLRIWEDSL